MSMKTISMDYPLLDSPKINAIRAKIQHDNDWGNGFYSLGRTASLAAEQYSLRCYFIGADTSIVFGRKSFERYLRIFLLLAFTAVILFNAWFSTVKRNEQYKLLDDPTLDKSFLGYFLWNPQNYHYGKDIRIYNTEPLIEQKLEGDKAVKQKWTRKLVCNLMESGFSASFSSGLLQLLSYLFVVIRAAAGALTIGNVVQYAGIIYRFSQSFASACSAVKEYSVSSDRQSSTLEYLHVKTF